MNILFKKKDCRRSGKVYTVLIPNTKTRLVKFKGMNKNMFNLHLKECEFRFNNRKQNLYSILLEIFRKEPLKLS